ncbi:MAG: DUF779 domain-containing protein [Zoogloea sp.]|nr:DUF779 domain-containing protein [Zoogloea sp.]
MVDRVTATPAALALVERLKAKHGELVFLLSGGCCEGTAANCFIRGEIQPGEREILLGEIGGCPFYISLTHYEFSRHTEIVIDAEPMRGVGGEFSLEAPEGMAFKAGSKFFTDEEWAELQRAGLV